MTERTGLGRDVFQCTESTPWDRTSRGPVRHHGAHEVGDQRDGYPGGYPGGDLVTMRCRFCGHEWETELPQ